MEHQVLQPLHAQASYPGMWHYAAERTFAAIDADGDGVAGQSDIASFLGGHLPAFEVSKCCDDNVKRRAAASLMDPLGQIVAAVV